MRPEMLNQGISEDVIQHLLRRWEDRIMDSHVAEFERPPAPAQPQHLSDSAPSHHLAYPPLPGPPSSSNRYELPPLPGPPPSTYQRGGNTSTSTMGSPYSTSDMSTLKSESPHPVLQRIPQLDGPSCSSSHEDEDDDDGEAAAHSSDGSSSPRSNPIPLPSLKKLNGVKQEGDHDLDDAIIGSDLDDSDDDDADSPNDVDLESWAKVLCLYDKVQRVKNKWKVTLKDGMIHVNGRDYLFSKCNGEFEW